MKYIWYRIRQAGFSLFMYLAPIRKEKVISGAGCLLQIPEKIKKSGKQKVLVVTTAGFMKRGSLTPFFDTLKKENLEYTVFSDVKPDPTTDCIEEAVSLYKKERCEVIVAIGGGSVIDCSKALGARIARPQKTLQQMQGLLKVLKPIPDLYAVPTTAGTGSEATAGAVITEGKSHYKFTILDLCLVPKYAVLDAQLTYALPAQITAYTGMDALTHAIEAYTNHFCFPLAKKKSLDAVKLIYENLEAAYSDGNNKEARENMLLASYYAGVAINNNFIGYVHAIAHGIGGLYGVTHGKANAIILPFVLKAYGKSIERKLSVLADLVGIRGNDEKEKAEAFIDSIIKLNEKLGIGNRLDDLQKKDFEELANRAVKEGNPTYPVPIIWEKDKFKSLMEKIV
ncbi:MAG: iron-containing alcohol dehydrogenase [Lachnospiraceae bacterium]|nr:iron-containing alcohol dehydrogenase [Lachnospiraceae bacterium]